MASGNKKTKAPKVPAPAPPQNEKIYDGDVLVGTKVYDKDTNSWITTYNKTPEQQKANADYENLRAKLMPKIGATDAEQEVSLDNFKKAYYDSNSRPIIDTAKKARQQAIENFNARGMLNSSSMSDLINRDINKTEDEGLQNVSSEAEMQKHNLKQQYDQNLLNTLAVAQGGQATGFNQGLSMGQFANNAAATGNSITSQNYQDRLNGITARFQMQQAANAANRGGGSGLLGAGLGAAGSIAAAAIPLMF